MEYFAGDAQQVADGIAAARFTPVRLRRGYDMADVDMFLDDLGKAIRAGEDPRPWVAEPEFVTTRLRESYAMEDVDALLEQIASWAEGRF